MNGGDQSAAGGGDWAAIHARRAQLADEPGVRLPRSAAWSRSRPTRCHHAVHGQPPPVFNDNVAASPTAHPPRRCGRSASSGSCCSRSCHSSPLYAPAAAEQDAVGLPPRQGGSRRSRCGGRAGHEMRRGAEQVASPLRCSRLVQACTANASPKTCRGRHFVAVGRNRWPNARQRLTHLPWTARALTAGVELRAAAGHLPHQLIQQQVARPRPRKPITSESRPPAGRKTTRAVPPRCSRTRFSCGLWKRR